ncbi:hypothetical protein [Halonotius roseus]|uniref:DUF4065 domain-containing protein n=1 Tax=Halonotius roseus TaxID=2511997 RepID=A0A544QQA0_9EURY|nr:hypothetical protein [Halonotius roseus]TQQ81625.1 hypothetical protein EWF95_01395 [Halonotius roseus]
MSKELEISREQLIPLALLHASGHEIKGKTRLQKLAFLLDKEILGEQFKAYDFKKYDYGPFSKLLLKDTERLQENDVVDINQKATFSGNVRYDYILNDQWLDEVEELADDDDIGEIFDAAEELVRKHEDKSIRDLVEYIYDKYPEYENNSVYQY